MNQPHPILGLWSLRSWVRDGLPYTAQPIAGFLHYAAEGTMALSIFEKHEPRVLTTYAGRYEIGVGEVIHYPSEGLSPAGIQERKIRRVQLDGDRLILSTPADRLVWQKLS